MTTPGAEPHLRALRTRLEAALPAALGLGVGRAPQGRTAPYVVLYPDPGVVWPTRLSGDRQRFELRFLVHAVGTGPEQAAWAGDRVRDVLLAGEPLSVADRRVHRLVQAGEPPPMTRDDDVNPPLYLHIAEYELRSDPA